MFRRRTRRVHPPADQYGCGGGGGGGGLHDA